MAMSTDKPQMTATPEEQVAAFERARKLLEKISPLLEGQQPYDVSMALQLLLAKQAYELKKSPEEILKVIAFNLPPLIEMWKNAFADVKSRMFPT